MNLSKETAKNIIDEVKSAIVQWPDFADVAKLPNRERQSIGKKITHFVR